MSSTFKYALVLTTLFLAAACKEKRSYRDFPENQNVYAQYFSINRDNDNRVVLYINENWGSERKITEYRLIDREVGGETGYGSDEIPVPLRRVVCMSSSHIAYINTLKKSNTIVAISGSQYINDSALIGRINKGEVYDIGFESSINYEQLLTLSPDLIFTYGISGENNSYIGKLRDMGFRVIVLGDYLEEHPLGKLEYLRLFGALYGKSEMADSIYTLVKERYIELRDMVKEVPERPKVLLNAPWKDVWYIPGKESYMTILIEDAGGEVLLSKAGKTIPYSVEEVYLKASGSEFWLNPNYYSDLKELASSNPLIAKLPVISAGKVYNNTKRRNSTGGSDFWEGGVVEPHIILNDLIKILHPDIGDGGDLKYYIELL